MAYAVVLAAGMSFICHSPLSIATPEATDGGAGTVILCGELVEIQSPGKDLRLFVRLLGDVPISPDFSVTVIESLRSVSSARRVKAAVGCAKRGVFLVDLPSGVQGVLLDTVVPSPMRRAFW